MKRNASRGGSRKQKYTQRLRDIAKADDAFINNLEENTNFTMPAGGRGRSKSKTAGYKSVGSRKPAPTILSQVKKYGIEEVYQFDRRFVTTRDQVTDDPNNYLERHSDFRHSHIYPTEFAKKQETKTGGDQTIKISKLYQDKPSSEEMIPPIVEEALREQRLSKEAFLLPLNEKQRKTMINMASAPKLDETRMSRNEAMDIKKRQHESSAAAISQNNDYDGDPALTEHKRLDSMPFTVQSQGTLPDVAKQIKEKAGSTDFRLNEDSEDSAQKDDTAPVILDTEPAKDSHQVSVEGEGFVLQDDQKSEELLQNAQFPIEKIAKKSRYQRTFFESHRQPDLYLSSNRDDLKKHNQNPEYQKIIDHVNLENKRLWRLYDNRLDGVRRGTEADAEKRRLRELQAARDSKDQRSEGAERVAEFKHAVKTHTMHRRDNLARNLANQTKESLDPYLRFQIKERKDPFKSRPLSSAIKQTGAMYPSRDAIMRANKTDGVPHPQQNFNSLRMQAKPGQGRPFSSNMNNILLIKEQEQQRNGRQGLSAGRLVRGKIEHKMTADESRKRSRQPTSKTTGIHYDIMSETQPGSDQILDQARQSAPQHQRLLSFQMSQGQVDQEMVSRMRPVASVPANAKMQFLSGNAEHRNVEQLDFVTGGKSSDPHGRDDFVNVGQMLDPSLAGLSQPLTGKGMSDANVMSGLFSGDGNHEPTAMQLGRPKSGPSTRMHGRPTRAGSGFKSTQNLISQLRIKSVRQSKVRIVKDPSSKDHFDIVIDQRDKGERNGGFVPQRHATARVPGAENKVISNATNLHRMTDSTLQNTPVLLSAATSKLQFNNQVKEIGDDPTEELRNEFPEENCEQLDLEILNQYGLVEHMKEFLVYSESCSPIFLFNPRNCAPTKVTKIFERFKECLEAGQLEQAQTMLDLGMKWKLSSHAFKFNAGVTYLLAHQYLEAVQTFRLLAKSFPASPSVHANLLTAYLCDGWVNNVKEFQSSALFNSIKAPLSRQTQCILELIKYAFMNPDAIAFSKMRQKSGKTKFSSNGQSEATLSRPMLHGDLSPKNELERQINEQSDVLEAEAQEENSSSDEDDEEKQVPLEFRNFHRHNKLKDYTKRLSLDPVNHMLRERLREARHPEIKRSNSQVSHNSRAKSASPNRMHSFGDLPNYWSQYQQMLQGYHRKDAIKDKQEKAYFDKVLDKIHKLCEDEEDFQPGQTTKIIKSLPEDHERHHTQNSGGGRTPTHKLAASSSNGTQQHHHPKLSEEDKKRREGDVNRILHKVKKVEEDLGIKDNQDDEGMDLDAIFIDLIDHRIENISESTSDPIEQSYQQLIDGLGGFHERYNVRNFIDQYIELLEDIKRSEEIENLIDEAGGPFKVDPSILAQRADRIELDKQFIAKFEVNDEQVERARTFILDILFKCAENEIIPMKKTFEDLAHLAEDKRRQMTMDKNRYNLEQPYIEVIRELIKLQQEVAHNIKVTKSLEVVKQLKGQSELNQAYIDLCNEQKELAGRHGETVLVKALEITKGEHAARADLEVKVMSPFNERNLIAKTPDQAKIDEYRELYTKGWKNFTYRLLDPAEKLKIVQAISQEADDVLQKARLRAQQKVVDNLAKVKRQTLMQQQTLEAYAARVDMQKELIAKREAEKVKKIRFENLQKSLLKGIGVMNEIKVAQHDIKDYEYGLIIKKLNLDAIEIENKLSNQFSPEADLWEETDAFKFLRELIKDWNEKYEDPGELIKRDIEKRNPLLEKWNMATEEVLDRAQNGKSLKHLSSAMNNELKDTNEVDEKNKHLQIRPRIGHEVQDTQIDQIETWLENWMMLSHKDQAMLDSHLSKNNRFFSIFDQTTRFAMYKNCRVLRHHGTETVIERDVEETENIQIILRGNIQIVQVNEELGIKLGLASLRAGQVCGDQSIQRKFKDPLKILSKERKMAVTNTQSTVTVSIMKHKFIEALFKEMQQELFYKIILLRNTPYFEQLSPYSLTIIASNVEVREVKYGEVIAQQGSTPDSMYILAYGQCKTLYQYVEQKSTKVSKYANKCLKTDLPQPIHTGMTNYRTLSKDTFNYQIGANSPINEEAEMPSSADKSQNIGEQTANKKNLRLPEAVQRKLAKMGQFSKRSFHHSILAEDKRNMTITFQNSLNYTELKVGEVFGMRALLDPLICKKHILEHRKLFCQRLDINLDNLWQELLKKQQLSLENKDLAKAKRKEANKRASKFCKICFEKRRDVLPKKTMEELTSMDKEVIEDHQDEEDICKCLLNKLSEKERKKADKERAAMKERLELGQESSFCPEFNDSHDFNMSLNESQIKDRQPKNKKKKNKDLDVGFTMNLDPDQAYREERDRIREQIEGLTKDDESSEEETKVQQKPGVKKRKVDHTKRLQEKVEEEFSTRLYGQVMQAQTSIIVTSSTAKFLVVKKEDKGLLNEYLRICIDKAILKTNFEDLDRPELSQGKVQTAVKMRRGWTRRKEKLMNDIMAETKMSKKANKLLDD